MEIHSQKVQGMMKQCKPTKAKLRSSNPNNSNEVEDEMLKGHSLSQIS